MTLPRFLDCAFTLIYDEYQRLGMDSVTAMEKLADWEPKRVRPERKKAESVAAKNDAAMRELQGMLSGLR